MPDTRITTMVNKITALQQAVNDLSQRQHDLEATQTEERARTDLKFGWIMAKLELLQSVRCPDKQPIHTNETTQPTPPSRQATFNCNNNHSAIVCVQQSTTALSENSSIVSAKPSFLSDNNITTLKLTPSTFKTGSPQTNSISPEKWSLPNGKTKNELQVPEYFNNELPSIVVAWIQVSFSTNLSSTCNNGLSVEISVPTRKANSSNMFCTQGVCQNPYEKLIVYFLRAKPPDDLPFNISREMVKCGVRLEMVQREMDALASEKESALKDLEATSEYLRTEEKERNALKVEVEVRSREVVELKAKVEEILVSENEVVKQLQRLMKYKNEMDVMIAGKVAVVCGYGDVGKGYTAALKQAGARVIVTEVDTICALHATIESLQILSLTDMVFETNILVTTTGNKDIIMLGDIRKIKNNAIVGNIGHFDNETDMLGIPVANFEGVKLLPYHQQIVHYRLLLKLVEHIYGLCKVLECIGNVSNQIACSDVFVSNPNLEDKVLAAKGSNVTNGSGLKTDMGKEHWASHKETIHLLLIISVVAMTQHKNSVTPSKWE